MTIAYIRQILIFIIVLIPFYAIVRYLWIRSASFEDGPRETSVIRWLIQDKKYPRELALALFILFTAGLLYLALQGTYTDPVQMLSNAVTRIKNNDGISLVPFRSIYRYFSHFELDIFLVNIGGECANVHSLGHWAHHAVQKEPQLSMDRYIVLCTSSFY